MSRVSEHILEKYAGILRRTCLAGLLLMLVCFVRTPQRAEAATVQQEVFSYLTGSGGLNPAAACGIMANIGAESGFIANINGLGGAYGFCQWGGPRITRLRSYCASHGLNSSTAAGQLRFIIYELQTYYPNVYNYLRSVPNTAQGAYNAGYYFCAYYEIPANRNVTGPYRGRLASGTYWPAYGVNAAYMRAYSQTNGIRLTWSGMYSGKLQVMRSASRNSGYKKVAELKKGTRTYIDKEAPDGKTNYYYIKMVNSSGKQIKRTPVVAVYRKKSLASENVSVSLSYDTITYNGRQRKPVATVKYGSKTLTKGRDYTVAYKNNINTGTAEIVLTGRGNYTGTTKKKFAITPAAWKYTVKATTVKLSQKTWKPQLQVQGLVKNRYAKKITLKSSDDTIAKVSGLTLRLKKKGTVKITVTVKAGGNYRLTEKSFKLTVN